MVGAGSVLQVYCPKYNPAAATACTCATRTLTVCRHPCTPDVCGEAVLLLQHLWGNVVGRAGTVFVGGEGGKSAAAAAAAVDAAVDTPQWKPWKQSPCTDCIESIPLPPSKNPTTPPSHATCCCSPCPLPKQNPPLAEQLPRLAELCQAKVDHLEGGGLTP